MQRALWIAVAAALIAPGAHADVPTSNVSNWCLWTQIQDLHAIAIRCAGNLSPEVVARYEKLRRASEAAILRDASLRAGESAESAQAEMDAYAAKRRPIDPKRCDQPDMQRAVHIFETFTSDDAANLLAQLAQRRDPWAGDCL